MDSEADAEHVNLIFCKSTRPNNVCATKEADTLAQGFSKAAVNFIQQFR